MLKQLGFSLVLTALVGSPVLGQDWATKMFETTEHDFGTVARAAKTEYDFVFSNIYLEDVHVVSARSSCGCTSVQVVTPSLKTYEKGAIHATFNTGSFMGDRGATLTVTIDKPYPAEVQLHVKGTIRSDVVMDPGSVQFGEVEAGTLAERKIAINYSGMSDWQLVGVKSSSPHVSARVVPTSQENGQVAYEMLVKLKPGAPAGYINEHLILQTNDQSQIPLLVEGRVLAGVTVSPASLFMGVVKSGQQVTKPLVVKGTKPFRILSIQCDDKSFAFGKETDSKAKTVHVIPVTFAAGTGAGKVTKTIRIETDLGQVSPPLPAYAVVTKSGVTDN